MSRGLYKVEVFGEWEYPDGNAEVFATYLVVAANEEDAEQTLRDYLEHEDLKNIRFLDVGEVPLDRSRVLGVLEFP